MHCDNGRQRNYNLRSSKLVQFQKTGQKHSFIFDRSYWSFDGFVVQPDGLLYPAQNSRYADQQRVFDDVGQDIISDALRGFHTCLLAYGQTGSGKSYSVLNGFPNQGIVPRACKELFQRLEMLKEEPHLECIVEMGMLEIYNEVIQDLLVPPSRRLKSGLAIREGPEGVYVEALKMARVYSLDEILNYLALGTRHRTIGATVMNAESSRAHTIVMIVLKQTRFDGYGEPLERKTAKMTLVDLAGSERVAATAAKGQRLREGVNINKSLSVLGKVIATLADPRRRTKELPPFRESKLTRILSNQIGGNCKTTMLAAISPASSNHGESLSTLRYANQVKNIKNKAKINESPRDQLIRLLQEENQLLKKNLARQQPQLSLAIQQKAIQKHCHLKNLNADPYLSGKVRLVIQNGLNSLGKDGDVAIKGLGVAPIHCSLDLDPRTGVCMVLPNDQPDEWTTLVNGKRIHAPTRLLPNDRLRLGLHAYFQYVDPNERENEEIDWEFASEEAQPQQFARFRAFQIALSEHKRLSDQIDLISKQLEQQEDQENYLIGKLMELQEKWERLRDRIKQEYETKIARAKQQDIKEYEYRMDMELGQVEKLQHETRRLIEMDPQQLLHLIRMKAREKFDKQLWDCLQKVPELNAIAKEMGFVTFLFEAELTVSAVEDLALPHTTALSPGFKPHLSLNPEEQVPSRSKVRVKAMPDKARQDLYRVLEYDQFLDLFERVKSRWEEYCFDETPVAGDAFLFGMVADQTNTGPQSQVFTLSTEGQASKLASQLITPNLLSQPLSQVQSMQHSFVQSGFMSTSQFYSTPMPPIQSNAPSWTQKQGTALIHLAACFHFLEVRQDETPIFSLAGKELALLNYSLIPALYHRDKTPESTLNHQDMSEADLMGRTLSLTIELHSVKNLHLKSGSKLHLSYRFLNDEVETKKVLLRENATVVEHHRQLFFTLNDNTLALFKDGYLPIHLFSHQKQEEHDSPSQMQRIKKFMRLTDETHLSLADWKSLYSGKKNEGRSLLEVEEADIAAHQQVYSDEGRARTSQQRIQEEEEDSISPSELQRENERLKEELELQNKLLAKLKKKEEGSRCRVCLIF